MSQDNKDKNEKKIKVRLDYRTIITLKSMDALKFWKTKYPKLQVLS